MSGLVDAQQWQDRKFYSATWCKEYKKCFLDSLVNLVQAGVYEGGWPNSTTVASEKREMDLNIDPQSETWVLNEEFGEDFDYEKLRRIVKRLKNRYFTFHHLLMMPDFTWFPFTNEVKAPRRFWRIILQTIALAKWYRWNGEPEYEYLTIIFEHAMVENMAVEVDVVDVSNNEDETEGDDADMSPIESEDEEDGDRYEDGFPNL
ncbi:hypothetical protein Salat_2793300 [Sesamum alatum]|uniref:Myb/SANT-like domain-containing protein n=1 Tax=Sesamum alatum TaxID=300844 RepID=A0AAE1XKV5_9LAMI|nr:hypothetical protein Salat_2793300 [Sesamum alatum]